MQILSFSRLESKSNHKMVDDNITETGDSQASSPVSRKSGKRINIVIESAFNGDLNKLQECFTNEDNPYHERLQEQINSIDEDGRSPVEIAATEGHVEMMKFLIEKGSEQDTRNPLTGKSPLDMACILGREDIVRELLANEVKYDATSVSGKCTRQKPTNVSIEPLPQCYFSGCYCTSIAPSSPCCKQN